VRVLTVPCRYVELMEHVVRVEHVHVVRVEHVHVVRVRSVTSLSERLLALLCCPVTATFPPALFFSHLSTPTVCPFFCLLSSPPWCSLARRFCPRNAVRATQADFGVPVFGRES
jgi:hypothetical protein